MDWEALLRAILLTLLAVVLIVGISVITILLCRLAWWLPSLPLLLLVILLLYSILKED